MSGNIFIFIGRVTKNPAKQEKDGKHYCRFTLMRNDRVQDGHGIQERTTAIPFIAFGMTAETIAAHCKKGDQLIVTATVGNYNKTQDGQVTYGYNFVVVSFEYGAPGEETRKAMT